MIRWILKLLFLSHLGKFYGGLFQNRLWIESLCAVLVSLCQTCPVYSGGYTSQTSNQGSGEVGIFLDTSPGHLIQCEGTVYAWHYCYYPTSVNISQTILTDAVFAIYYHEGASEDYLLRQGSRLPLFLSVREAAFSCGTVNLSESDYFRVYSGDSVGVCLIENGTAQSHQLDMVTSHPSSSAVHWSTTNRRCSLSDMQESIEDCEQNMRYLIHLSVDISKQP